MSNKQRHIDFKDKKMTVLDKKLQLHNLSWK